RTGLRRPSDPHGTTTRTHDPDSPPTWVSGGQTGPSAPNAGATGRTGLPLRLLRYRRAEGQADQLRGVVAELEAPTARARERRVVGQLERPVAAQVGAGDRQARGVVVPERKG